MNDDEQEKIQQAAQWILEADAIWIGAGAGIGVDSGLPDFRGNEGFWKAYPPFHGKSFSQIANPQNFFKDARMAWGFYGHRLHLYRKTQPHLGFEILKSWIEKLQKPYYIYTSNVDGQFQKAGFDDKNIVECHGSIHHFQCWTPCQKAIWHETQAQLEIDPTSFRAQNDLPTCSLCGAIARPNILMFGDYYWNSTRTEMQEMRYEKWLREHEDQKIVAIELGAGTTITSVRNEARKFQLIRINPRESSVENHAVHPAIGLAFGAKEGLLRIDEALKSS